MTADGPLTSTTCEGCGTPVVALHGFISAFMQLPDGRWTYYEAHSAGDTGNVIHQCDVRVNE